jgi:hypothetical protein
LEPEPFELVEFVEEDIPVEDTSVVEEGILAEGDIPVVGDSLAVEGDIPVAFVEVDTLAEGTSVVEEGTPAEEDNPVGEGTGRLAFQPKNEK